MSRLTAFFVLVPSIFAMNVPGCLAGDSIRFPIYKGESIKQLLPLYVGSDKDRLETSVRAVRNANPKLLDSNGVARFDSAVSIPAPIAAIPLPGSPASLSRFTGVRSFFPRAHSGNSGSAGTNPGPVDWSDLRIKPFDVYTHENGKTTLEWTTSSAFSKPPIVTTPYIEQHRFVLTKPAVPVRDFIPSPETPLPSPDRVRLAEDDAQPDPSSCHLNGRSPAWPYNASAIEQIFERVRRSRSIHPRTALILVADTGLDISRAGHFLWTNVESHEYTSSSASPYVNDTHGASMVTFRGDIAPNDQYVFARHGTQVVEVMTDALLHATKLQDAFSIAMAKMTKEQRPYEIDEHSINEVFVYSRAIRANVLNLSVVFGDQLPGLVNGLANSDRTVVVAAAGNNSAWVETKRIFPAALNMLRDHLIVVGANDWSTGLASFSNKGALVDLLGPGCAIPISGGDPSQPSLVSGTSFAAPFVSLTAALLWSLGLDPESIKTRIKASVDFDPKLVGLVDSAGRLNIESALSADVDLVSFRDRNGNPTSPVAGELRTTQIWQCHKQTWDRTLAPHTVVRIVPHYPSPTGQGTIVDVLVAAPGSPTNEQCESITGNVAFRRLSEPKFSDYDWKDIAFVVPRYFWKPK